MGKLGIVASDISTQVAPRENLARIICDIAILAATVEQIAKEVRNLQRTEIAEAGEPFGKSQVGSSTMAQKRNPINSENICGNARVIRSCVAPVLEDIALEHERDLTNSACERSVLPTAFVLLDDVLIRMSKILSRLVVNPDNMAKNLSLTKGTIMAESIITRLVQKGMGRQDAHEILRQGAFEALSKNIELKEVLQHNETVANYLSKEEIEEYASYNSYIGRSVPKTEFIINKWKIWNP
jgi:adenylosuccinate lyase